MTAEPRQLGRLGLSLLVGVLLVIAPLSSSTAARTDDALTVAVAANFTRAMEAIERRFEAATGEAVTFLFASTGTLYAQITNGAPVDAFFAADVERPQQLAEDGAIVEGSRFTYAIGRPVLWSSDEAMIDSSGEVLETGEFRRLAMAKPSLAPYGEAARQIMIERGVWDELRSRNKIVFGQNVNQAHQFIRSGNAELGFIALSQVIDPESGEVEGSRWQPPATLHDPVKQQAVILERTHRPALARSFMDFVRSEAGTEIMETFGYAVPEARDASSE